MISVYLDSQDYLKLYNAKPGTEHASLRDQLLQYSTAKKVEFRFSFLILGELLRDFDLSHENDRLARAKFIELLCGSAGVPYFSELAPSHIPDMTFSWLPRDVEKVFSLSSMKSKLLDKIRTEPRLNRSARRMLASESKLEMKGDASLFLLLALSSLLPRK